METTSLLSLRGVEKRFGGVVAIRELNMDVRRGSIHGLMGPNGSGKSTVFNLVSGVAKPNKGRVYFKGDDITDLAPHRVTQRGIARTFQGVAVFDEFTVDQNLSAAAELVGAAGVWATLFNRKAYRTRSREAHSQAEEVIRLLRLECVADQVVSELPHRERRAVALGNALVTGADLIMLDELMAGLTAQETEEFLAVLRQVASQGITLLVVEHNIAAVMRLCDHLTVLNHGEAVADGEPSAIRQNEAVIGAYLGTAG